MSRNIRFEGLGQKVCRSHPRLHGPKRMFDRLAADAHAMGRAIEPLLHRVKNSLVLPTRRCSPVVHWDLSEQRAHFVVQWRPKSHCLSIVDTYDRR